MDKALFCLFFLGVLLAEVEELEGFKRVELLLAAPSSCSPASIAGHTYLLLSREKKEEGLSPVLGYVAEAASSREKSIILYVLKGLAGGYRTVIQVEPLQQALLRNTVGEDRDVYRLTLSLTEREKRRLVLVLKEMKREGLGRYFFLGRNCTSQLLTLLNRVLEEGRRVPDWEPVDLPTVAAARLYRRGIASLSAYYPSISHRARHSLRLLSRMEGQLRKCLKGDLEGLEALDILSTSCLLLVYRYLSHRLRVEALRSWKKAGKRAIIPRDRRIIWLMKTLVKVRARLFLAGKKVPELSGPPAPPAFPPPAQSVVQVGLSSGLSPSLTYWFFRQLMGENSLFALNPYSRIEFFMYSPGFEGSSFTLLRFERIFFRERLRENKFLNPGLSVVLLEKSPVYYFPFSVSLLVNLLQEGRFRQFVNLSFGFTQGEGGWRFQYGLSFKVSSGGFRLDGELLRRGIDSWRIELRRRVGLFRGSYMVVSARKNFAGRGFSLVAGLEFEFPFLFNQKKRRMK